MCGLGSLWHNPCHNGPGKSKPGNQMRLPGLLMGSQ